MFIVFSNGVGPDEEEVRTGNAMLLDPYGRILAETWVAADAMVVAELDFALLDRCTGQRWQPHGEFELQPRGAHRQPHRPRRSGRAGEPVA